MAQLLLRSAPTMPWLTCIPRKARAVRWRARQASAALAPTATSCLACHAGGCWQPVRHCAGWRRQRMSMRHQSDATHRRPQRGASRRTHHAASRDAAHAWRPLQATPLQNNHPHAAGAHAAGRARTRVEHVVLDVPREGREEHADVQPRRLRARAQVHTACQPRNLLAGPLHALQLCGAPGRGVLALGVAGARTRAPWMAAAGGNSRRGQRGYRRRGAHRDAGHAVAQVAQQAAVVAGAAGQVVQVPGRVRVRAVCQAAAAGREP